MKWFVDQAYVHCLQTDRRVLCIIYAFLVIYMTNSDVNISFLYDRQNVRFRKQKGGI